MISARVLVRVSVVVSVDRTHTDGKFTNNAVTAQTVGDEISLLIKGAGYDVKHRRAADVRPRMLANKGIVK